MPSNAAARTNGASAPETINHFQTGKMYPLARYAVESGLTLPQVTRAMRGAYISALLVEYRGNQCAAAKAGGMHRNTMARDIQELRLGPWLAELRANLHRRGAPASSRALSACAVGSGA